MKQDYFFKPTLLLKKYLLLDLIEKNISITQREIARELDISVALVNKLLTNFEEEELLTKDIIN
jgi:DNA-binding MarR family transcriptional regulator